MGYKNYPKRIPVMDLRQYADYFDDISWFDIEEFEDRSLLGKGTDWQDAVFRQAIMQNHQLTISGGNDKTRFAISGAYHFKEGIVIGSDFTRFSGKINLDHKVSDRIRMGNSLLISRTSENITFNDNSNGVVYTALRMVPNVPVYNADGSFAGPSEEDVSLSFDNPVARALDTKDKNTKTRLLSNFFIEADIFPFLTYRTELGADLIYSNHNTSFPAFQRGNFFGKSGVRRSLTNSSYWINKHLLTFKKTFAEKHKLTTLFGFEAQASKYEWLFARRDNLPTNDLAELVLGNAGQQENSGGAGHWALLSYFTRANYIFDERWLVTATLRYDGSSRFGANNRYGLFPSAALAWRVSNEAFLKDQDVIDNLKIRAGIGTTGNQEIGLYSFVENLSGYVVAIGDDLTTAIGPANIANPDVKWESSFQGNFGVDIGLFKNRIELIADIYNRRSDGMLLPVLLPATAGSLDPPFVNVGEVVNRGLELSLKTVNSTGKLSWRSTVNFTINRNEVISLGSTGNLVGQIQRINVTRTEERQPISQFYGYVTDGIFQTQAEVQESPTQRNGTRAGDIKFKDLNNDGIINEDDQTFIGSPHPDFTLNMSHDLEFKGFDFNIFVQGVFGNEILNLIRRDIEGMAGFSNQSIVVIDRYRNGAPSTEVPRATDSDPNDNRRVSDRFIEDGTFVRIKNMTLGYTFPKQWLAPLKLRYVRAYISTQNLLTWTNYSGYDPDVGSYNQNPLINGVENGRYPISRSYTFGINANF